MPIRSARPRSSRPPAGKAVGQAIEALQIASAGCANYANQI
jgi:hypothetical protein